MFNASYHLAMARLRAEQLERNAARFRPPPDRARPALRSPQSVTMRLALPSDATRLEQIPGVARDGLPLAPLLIGEVAGQPVAVLSLSDGAIVAKRVDAARDVVALLRFRAAQVRRARA
jgi:hypothetical protein